AWNWGSGRSSDPLSEKLSPLVGEGRRLSDDRPVVSAAVVPFAELALEAFKKFCPVVSADDKHIAAVVLIPFTAQIAERAKRIQGAGTDWLGMCTAAGAPAEQRR